MRSDFELLDQGPRTALRATLAYPRSPARACSIPSQLAPALALVLCASMAHSQSAIDGGRTVPAAGATMLAGDSAGSFAGRVVQEDGTPVAGAVVSVFGASDSALTATDGHFEVHRLAFGAHMVSARRRGDMDACSARIRWRARDTQCQSGEQLGKGADSRGHDVRARLELFASTSARHDGFARLCDRGRHTSRPNV